MAIHTEVDMSSQRAAGDLIPEGWYHVRVREVKEATDESSGETRVQMQLVIQDEPLVGEIIFDQPSLNHKLGLSKIKTYYKAVGYNPGPEGHDPEKLLNTEFYVAVEHNAGKPGTKNEGMMFANIPAWSIRSLQDGIGKKVYSTQPRA